MNDRIESRSHTTLQQRLMTSPRSWLTLVTLLLTLTAVSVNAQVTPIQRIRGNPASFVNAQVTVEGKVVRYVDASGSNAFYFEDDYGTQIRIVSTQALPPVDSRWAVSGVVALEPSGDPYLVEATRAPRAGTAPPPSDPASPPPAAPTDSDLDGVADTSDRCPASPMGALVDAQGCEAPDRVPLYLGLGALALALGGGGLVLSQRSRRQQAEDEERARRDREDRERREREDRDRQARESQSPAAAPASGGEDFFAGKTIRFAKPTGTDGTLKLVPGRLEVISGPDKGNELRFVHVGTPIPEVTFGRSEGPKYTHVTLTAPTVSRRHAMMRYEAGAWSIANFSETNPVTLNANPLLAIGTPVALKDGDVIEFGEVGVKFHSR